MPIALLRRLFKEIRTLQTKNYHLASITRSNLRLYFEQYKTAESSALKRKPMNNQSIADLTSFIEMLSEANKQGSQFSQNQKLKLVEISYNINQFVDKNFRLRPDLLSKQMKTVRQNQQFMQLKSEGEREFVLKTMKKIYQGEQTFDYPHLSDFFSDKRFQKSSLRGRKQLQKLDEDGRQHVTTILSGQQKVTSGYREIYEYYFAETSSQQITFSNYLDSHFILRDFDDTALDWATNTNQKQQTKANNQYNSRINSQRKRQANQQKRQFKKQILQQFKNVELEKQNEKLVKTFARSYLKKDDGRKS